MRVARDATVMRLQERHADYLAVGYLGYYRMDIRSNDLRGSSDRQPCRYLMFSVPRRLRKLNNS